MKVVFEKHLTPVMRVEFRAQYSSLILEDMGEDPWGNCSVKVPKSHEEAVQQIKDYRKQYPSGVNRFRIKQTVTTEQTTEYTTGE